MQKFIDFLMLRSTFKPWGFRLLWIAYVIHSLIRFYGQVVVPYRANGIANFDTTLFYLVTMLDIFVDVAVVRLLIEVAALILGERNKK